MSVLVLIFQPDLQWGGGEGQLICFIISKFSIMSVGRYIYVLEIVEVFKLATVEDKLMELNKQVRCL